MGVPAVNFGPGDPNLAHMDDEQCPVEQYVACEAALLRWLRLGRTVRDVTGVAREGPQAPAPPGIQWRRGPHPEPAAARRP